MKLRVINKTNGVVLAARARLASSFYDRFIGLMGQAELPPGDGLHLVPCNSIHTFFMRFPIDVVFLDTQNRVVSLRSGLRPWRATAIGRAHSVLELPTGVAAATGTSLGNLLTFTPV